MRIQEKIITLVNSGRPLRYLLYGFGFILALDFITTALELIFIKGTREKNPAAYYLIQEFGIIPGLIISVLVELVFWALIYAGLKKNLHRLLKKGDGGLNISNASGMVVLVIAFIFHFKGLINNLGVLASF